MRERRRFGLGIIPKVSKFRKHQISYFAIFYSMMCILNYALYFIGNYIRLYSVEIGCKITQIFSYTEIFFVYVGKSL